MPTLDCTKYNTGEQQRRRTAKCIVETSRIHCNACGGFRQSSPFAKRSHTLVNAFAIVSGIITKGVEATIRNVGQLGREGMRQTDSAALLDTRTVSEYSRGHMEGFRNIPVDELRERPGERDKAKPVYVMCQSGLRSCIATRILIGNGFDCYNFAGGYRLYDTVTNDKCLIKSVTACGMDKG